MDLKGKIQNRKVVIGGWLQSGSSRIAGLMASAGLDWVAVDMEHGSVSNAELPEIFDIIKKNGAYPLARIQDKSEMSIRLALDAGADGIIVPMVESEADANGIINSACYPPKGKRGIGFCHANNYGRDFDDYLKKWNKKCLIIVQIETLEGLKNADAILMISGIDGYMIGPYDLTGSMGILGDFDHPRFQKALKELRDSADRHKKAAGIHQVQPDIQKVKKLIKDGYSFIAYSLDTVVIVNHFSQLVKQIKKRK